MIGARTDKSTRLRASSVSEQDNRARCKGQGLTTPKHSPANTVLVLAARR